eukprot:1542142-Rhodomonas_salina.1
MLLCVSDGCVCASTSASSFLTGGCLCVCVCVWVCVCVCVAAGGGRGVGARQEGCLRGPGQSLHREGHAQTQTQTDREGKVPPECGTETCVLEHAPLVLNQEGCRTRRPSRRPPRLVGCPILPSPLARVGTDGDLWNGSGELYGQSAGGGAGGGGAAQGGRQGQRPPRPALQPRAPPHPSLPPFVFSSFPFFLPHTHLTTLLLPTTGGGGGGAGAHAVDLCRAALRPPRLPLRPPVRPRQPPTARPAPHRRC